jgi:bacillithiol system protein YtxJ
MSIERISTDAVESLLHGATPRLIFKHSPTCGISSAAFIEVSLFAESRPDARVVLVDVRRERGLSQQIAIDLGLPHASPQAILVADGRACWHASHGNVTVQQISRAFDALRAGDGAASSRDTGPSASPGSPDTCGAR